MTVLANLSSSGSASCHSDFQSIKYSGKIVINIKVVFWFSVGIRFQSLCSCLKIELQDCEIEILCLTLHPSDIIVIIYHPYWGKSLFLSVVTDTLADIVAHGCNAHSLRNFLVCGDFKGLSESVSTISSLLDTVNILIFPHVAMLN